MRLPITVLAVLLLASSLTLAQKVTVDPNRPGAAKTQSIDEKAPYDPARDPDKRMAQKISYKAKHVRLSAVVADILKMTGVTVICGKNTTDWPSRDVPVTVFAKDLPLGVLLRALARATHNELRVQKTDTSYTYRIAQSTRLAKQIRGFYTAREDYCKTINAWNWDAAVAMQDIPDEEFAIKGSRPEITQNKLEFAKSVSRLLAALGPSHKQRVIDGERLTLELSQVSSELREPVKAVLQAADKLLLEYDRPHVGVSPNARATPLEIDRLEKGNVVIYGPLPNDAHDFSPLYTYANNNGVPIVSQTFHPSELLAKEAAKKRFGNPPKLSTPIEDDEDWNIDYRDPLEKEERLDTKLDFSDFAKSTECDIAEIYAALAERAGYSIVIEDWWFLRGGHSADNYEWKFISASDTWESKLKSQDLKSFLPNKAFKEWGHYRCHLNRRDKLIVGIDREWSLRHLGLIPATLYESTVKKLNGDGVDVDDLAPLLCLTPVQWQESVKHSKNLSVVEQHAHASMNPLWEFHAGLQAHEKAQAKSTGGLVLARFDQTAIANLIKRTCRYTATRYDQYPSFDHPERLALHLKPVDEEVPKVTSRYTGPLIDYSDIGRRLIGGKPVFKKVPGLTSYTNYQLSVRSIDKPDKNILATVWVQQLPFYSEQRAAELAKYATEPNK